MGTPWLEASSVPPVPPWVRKTPHTWVDTSEAFYILRRIIPTLWDRIYCCGAHFVNRLRPGLSKRDLSSKAKISGQRLCESNCVKMSGQEGNTELLY